MARSQATHDDAKKTFPSEDKTISASGFFDDKVVFITGGSGSWGNELVSQLLENNDPAEIRIYSRGEPKQVEMKRRFANEKRIKYLIGDVRDKERLKLTMQGVDFVFHLAALKHVPICEENPWESVLTNVVGIQNVIEAAIANKVEKVIDISTDKAVDPFNMYGTCKAVGEKLMIAANLLESDTRFVCIRGGNVLGTQGSVVPLFREQILRAGLVTITDGSMTRYMMRLKEAIGLIFEATIWSLGGEVFVMKMPSLTVKELAEVMIDNLGKYTKKSNYVNGKPVIELKQIGIRPGEKKHEVLVSKYETPNCIDRDPYFIILPMIHLPWIEDAYKDVPRIEFEEFNSTNAHRLSKEEIRQMLLDEGWLTPNVSGESYLSALAPDELSKFFEEEGWKSRITK